MAALRGSLVISATLAVALGCGGHKAQPAPPPPGGDDTGGGGGGEVSANPCGDDGMCPPETLDRIKEALDAKRVTMSRCLSDAQDNGGAKRNAKGTITLQFVITTSGKA